MITAFTRRKPGEPQILSITATPDQQVEGSFIQVLIETSNIPDGGQVYWWGVGGSASFIDVSSQLTTDMGWVTINNNSALVQLYVVPDAIDEQVENFILFASLEQPAGPGSTGDVSTTVYLYDPVDTSWVFDGCNGSGDLIVTPSGHNPPYILDYSVNGVTVAEGIQIAGNQSYTIQGLNGNVSISIEGTPVIPGGPVGEPYTETIDLNAITAGYVSGFTEPQYTLQANGTFNAEFTAQGGSAPYTVVYNEVGLATTQTLEFSGTAITITGLAYDTNYNFHVYGSESIDCGVHGTLVIPDPCNEIIKDVNVSNGTCGDPGQIQIGLNTSPGYGMENYDSTYHLLDANGNIIASFGPTNNVQHIFNITESGEYGVAATYGPNGSCYHEWPATYNITVDVVNITSSIVQTTPGGASGTVSMNLTVSGGAAPYYVTISQAQVGVVQSNLGPIQENTPFTIDNLEPDAIHVYEITDSNGCQDSNVFTSPSACEPSGLYFYSAQDDAGCYNNQGFLYVQVTNNTYDDYVFTIDPEVEPLFSDGISAVWSGLSAASYTITVTYNGGQCSDSLTREITAPPEMEPATVIVEGQDCFDDGTASIQFIADPAGQPYQNITINPSPGGASGGSTANGQVNWAGINPGNYTITATNSYGCGQLTQVTVPGPTSPVEITSISGVDLGGIGQFNLTVTGGTPFSPPYNSSNEPYQVGGYYVINGQPYGINPTTVSYVGGGYNFQIVNVQLAPALYYITAQDANGCQFQVTARIQPGQGESPPPR